jgi:catechol 2,3-dioxygenase-like lactoylglutathione lyase family enzyme
MVRVEPWGFALSFLRERGRGGAAAAARPEALEGRFIEVGTVRRGATPRRTRFSRRIGGLMATARYIVTDVDVSVRFYTAALGFELRQDMSPAFASVARGDLELWLAGPAASASRPMPDGRRPEPGGWNRIVIEVDDIEALVSTLRAAGHRFRNDVISGPGGKQTLLEDPSGNAIEIFEPARR